MNPYAARQPVGEGTDAAFGTGLPKFWRLAAVRIAYHDFEGVTVHAEEGPRLLESIGHAQAVILRNHGLLSWGPDIPNAFIHLWSLQRACEIQVAGAALGPTSFWLMLALGLRNTRG